MRHFFMLSVSVMYDVFLDLLEEVGGKHKVAQRLVGRLINDILVPYPFTVALIDKYDILTYTEHRVHVMGVYDRRYAIFMGYVAQQFVDKYRGLWVEARIGLVAKQIFRIKSYSACYGHTFLHAARYLAWILVVSAFKPYALKTEPGTVATLGIGHLGVHHDRKLHIAEHRL